MKIKSLDDYVHDRDGIAYRTGEIFECDRKHYEYLRSIRSKIEVVEEDEEEIVPPEVMVVPDNNTDDDSDVEIEKDNPVMSETSFFSFNEIVEKLGITHERFREMITEHKLEAVDKKFDLNVIEGILKGEQTGLKSRMNMSEVVDGDLENVFYADFGEEFIHKKGESERKFVGIWDVKEDEVDDLDSNLEEIRIRSVGKVGDFNVDDVIVRGEKNHKVVRVEPMNAEELLIYVT